MITPKQMWLRLIVACLISVIVTVIFMVWLVDNTGTTFCKPGPAVNTSQCRWEL